MFALEGFDGMKECDRLFFAVKPVPGASRVLGLESPSNSNWIAVSVLGTGIELQRWLSSTHFLHRFSQASQSVGDTLLARCTNSMASECVEQKDL